MQDVRCQRGAAAATCARLESGQFPTHPGDARADQGLVADEPEGEADQDRHEGGAPRPLQSPSRWPRWQSHSIFFRRFCSSSRTAAAAATSTGTRCLIIKQQWQPSEGVRPNAMQKSPYQTFERHSGACDAGNGAYLRSGLPGSPENRYNPLRFRGHPGNSGLSDLLTLGQADSRETRQRRDSALPAAVWSSEQFSGSRRMSVYAGTRRALPRRARGTASAPPGS